MTSTRNILELSGVTKRYGRVTALDDVSLTTGPGIVGLLGPNGSGKSTLIKSLLGLLQLQAGSATVLGFELPRQLRSIRDRVGYLPEDDCFIAGLTGIESVQFMARLSGLPRVEGLRRAHEVLDYADVGQERYRQVETYSTGMRQKLKFAQALVHDPELIIFDEPTNGLDPEQRVAMLKKIRNLATNHRKSVLISTHILHDVRSICEQVVIMTHGRVRLIDSLENLSRPTRQGLHVRVERRLEATPEEPFPDARKLLDALIAEGIAAELNPDGSLWVSAIDDRDCGPVWQAAKSADVYVQQLEAARNSLEVVFFQAVQEAHDATA